MENQHHPDHKRWGMSSMMYCETSQKRGAKRTQTNKKNQPQTKKNPKPRKTKTPRYARSLQSRSVSISLRSYLLTFWWLFSPSLMVLHFVRSYTDRSQEPIHLKNIFLFLCSLSACSLCSLVLSVTVKATAWDTVKAQAVGGGSWQQSVIKAEEVPTF